jgi:hypothetical protein
MQFWPQIEFCKADDLGWSDAEMADALDVTEPLYRQVKSGGVELLTASQKLRIVDRWGYGRVRNALLSVRPDLINGRSMSNR